MLDEIEFRPVTSGRKLESWLATLKGKSGVYIIRENFVRENAFTRRVVYVGESHTGRLKKTLLRHFQAWTGKTKGKTYARSKVEVAIITTSAKNAVDAQNGLIAELMPEDNEAGKPQRWFEKFFG